MGERRCRNASVKHFPLYNGPPPLTGVGNVLSIIEMEIRINKGLSSQEYVSGGDNCC